MHMQRKQFLGTLALALIVSGAAGAADKMQPAASAMPADPAAMMQKAKPFMTPGAEHQALDPMVGRWNAKVSMWMKPGDMPQVSTGTAEMSWVLDKHFIRQDYTGDMGGQRFAGVGYTGYDKVRGEYQSVWLDNMMTGMMLGTGTSPDSGKTIKQEGTFGCPITQDKHLWFRTETRMDGKDKIVYSSYGKDPQGKEYKGMEIVYTRVK
jgi:hypothetical protein